MHPPIGIDLGTTYSLVAVLEHERPRLLPNALGEYLTPSVVALTDKEEILVGRAAVEMAITDPDRTAALFKRSMGTRQTYRLGGQDMSAQVLSSCVLQALAQDAAQALGREVRQVVITVPAYFNDAQRQATIDAGELAGLEVLRLLNEPTAAALAYGLGAPGEEHKILVFDLGGGTFDVSILECDDGVMEVLASAGEAFLGGEDFTDRLLDHRLEAEGLTRAEVIDRDPTLLARLRRRVELAKRELSRVETVTLPRTTPKEEGSPAGATLTVTRSEFEALCRPLVERFKPKLWVALRDAGLLTRDIDRILLVGGATRMPMIHGFVRDFFGQEPATGLDPDQTVARGAAIQAGLTLDDAAVTDLVVTDVMPHTLGIEVSKEFGNKAVEGYFLPIIERNTTIPVSREDVVTPVVQGQRQLQVEIYQGESRRCKENLKLGTLKVKRLPTGPIEEAQVQVRFTYDLNGVLEVEAKVLTTGETVSTVIEQRPGRMSPSEIKRALKAMQALKVHPRDRQANQHILAWGKRLFSEHTGQARHLIETELTAFEEVLEERDPARIAEAREAIRRLFTDLDRGQDG